MRGFSGDVKFGIGAATRILHGLYEAQFDVVANEWTQISASTPSPRVGVGMAMHLGTRRVVAFGGMSDAFARNAVSETWELSGYFRAFAEYRAAVAVEP